MKCIINIGEETIGGLFIPNENYSKYQALVQTHCNNKGISNIHDFDYRITLSDNIDLNMEGGIGITDVQGFNEIYIEGAGLNQYQLSNFR
ncbi:hypothetical protein [Pedobacter sp. UYP1]|uniref:hypothetical protein n=1 Tax=Pedobacter sp. UYP1 TaxID=1756396 RepID=UPI00339637B6